MIYIFLILIILLGLIWGVTSISQSYASAKQAQASIEIAHTAQIASTGNVVVILILSIIVIMLLSALLWLVLSQKNIEKQHQYPKAMRSSIPSAETFQTLTLLALMQIIQRQSPALEEHHIDEEIEEDIWLLP